MANVFAEAPEPEQIHPHVVQLILDGFTPVPKDGSFRGSPSILLAVVSKT